MVIVGVLALRPSYGYKFLLPAKSTLFDILL